jgi:methanogenic corrinoid protein MtbC1
MPAGGGGLWAAGSGADGSAEPGKVSDETPTGVPSPESDQRRARLMRTIEGEIVPRLVLTKRVSRATGHAVEGLIRAPDETDVAELVRLLLAHGADVAAGYVETVRHRGASLESVCLKLLAPAARELGLMWENDECDFMQVTVGLCRLHQVLRDMSAEWRSDEVSVSAERTILLAPIPGEQHTFGLLLVAQFMRQAGWDVWQEFPDNLADLLDAVRRHCFAVVGLSVGCDTRLDDVAALISSIRCASHNRSVAVMVGGPVMVSNPGAACLVGADATAADGRCAVLQAERLFDVLSTTH